MTVLLGNGVAVTTGGVTVAVAPTGIAEGAGGVIVDVELAVAAGPAVSLAGGVGGSVRVVAAGGAVGEAGGAAVTAVKLGLAVADGAGAVALGG